MSGIDYFGKERRFWVSLPSGQETYYRENGPAIENCSDCINNYCCKEFFNYNYNRHFSSKYSFKWVSPKEFAIETNHIICKSCNDFCKQECFI